MGTYSYAGKPEFVTVATTGTYDITAYGAQGGAITGSKRGGYGAETGGVFNLTAGEKLEIVVGGAGTSISSTGGGGGGGGGGTFVLANTGPGGTYVPLLVAGGGGGSGSGGAGGAGSFANSAVNSSSGGGSIDSFSAGGGGAGVKASGVSASGGGGGQNGPSYAGGTGSFLSNGASSGNGGFGGGGGGSVGGAGGGGGYSGGAGGGVSSASGGGTSFDSAGTPLVAQSAGTENTARGGNGLVVLSTAAPLTTLVSFTASTNGSSPYGSLVADSNGNLFGTAEAGGANGKGTLFELKNSGTLATPLYTSAPNVLLSFNTTNGASPFGSLIIDSNGNLFGTASGGGSGFGLMFELKNTGTLAAPAYGASPAQEVKFGSAANPVGSFLTDRFFNLYGTTLLGGANGDGSVFLMANVGTLAAPVYNTANTITLASFTGTGNGANPIGSLIADAAGDFYATTSAGGASNDGTVFELQVSSSSSTGYTTPVTLATFTGTANGATPDGSLITDGAGDLFGTTSAGGANGTGTVFELKNTGTNAAPAYANGAITLANFNGKGTGSTPKGSLIIDAAGDLFGTTSAGGLDLSGTVFEIAEIGGVYESTPITVDTFTGTGNGATPDGSLIADAAGDLYGTTSAGGTNGNGTAFEITNSGFVSIETLVAFNGTDGSQPKGALIADASGDLYGTTFYYGGTGFNGSVFELTNTGTLAAPVYAGTPTTLTTFSSSTGANPNGSLTADAKGDLFGTTSLDGSGNGGTVFELVNTGTVSAPVYSGATTIAAFISATGQSPRGNVFIDANGNLFGTTYTGPGSNTNGTVFEVKNTGTAAAPNYASSTPVTLASFNGTNGTGPVGSLLADAAGDFFGTTDFGGADTDGTVFELKNTGTVAAPTYSLMTLFSFTNVMGGYYPSGSLIADAAGDLFGTATSGGNGGNKGTVFELVNTGTVAAPAYGSNVTTLVSFNGTDGTAPQGSLIADAAGDLFGTTKQGGAYNDGTVFELKNLGTLASPVYASTPTITVSFNGADGSALDGDLYADATGHLYGTTNAGGASSDGTLFEVNGLTFVTAPMLTATAANPAYTEGGAAAVLYSAAAVSTPVSDQGNLVLTLTVSNVIDGSNEILSIDGSQVALTNNNFVAIPAVGLSASVKTVPGAAIVTLLSSGPGLSSTAVQTLVDSLSYQDNGQNPTAGSRVVTLTSITDKGGSTALSLASTVSVMAVDTAPAISLPSTYSATEQTNLSLQGAGLSVSDVDANGGSETVTLSVNEGLLTFTAGNSGTTLIAASTSNGGSSVSFSGTIAQLNAMLSGTSNGTIVYNDNTGAPSASTLLTLSINDNGNTGKGGPDTTSATVSINIAAVNDAPTAKAPTNPYSATAGANLALQGTGLSVGDVDGGTGSETVSLSAGEGIVTVAAGSSGITGISGNGTGFVSFSGTIAQLNALLGGTSSGTILYDDTATSPSASTSLTLVINDNGNTGSGGAQVANAAAPINVSAAPVTVVVGTAAYISANIDALEANSSLTSIIVTDPVDPVTITYTQFTNDTAAVDKLGGTYSLLVTGNPGGAGGNNAFEYDYIAGVYTTGDYFYPASSQPYSSYEYVYSAGTAMIGSKFFYTGIANQAYTGEEIDYTPQGVVTRQNFTGVTNAAYSSYEYDYAGGVLSGKKFDFTNVPSGATYNSYVQDFNSANAFTGEQFFFSGVTGQPYTVQEDDFDASQKLSAIKLSGFAPSSPYFALEEDYTAGNSSTYISFKVFYTGQTGQFADTEEDATSANVVTKVVYSAPTNSSTTPYSSVEQDYTSGAETSAIYDFTNISGQPYYSYQVKDNPAGVALSEILDNNDGSHTIYALANSQSLTSLGDDTFIGGSFANDTFVFNPTYGQDTIADFGSHYTGTGHDTISFSTSEFASVAAVLLAAQNTASGNVVITAPTGDMLTLDNVTTSQLNANQSDFTLH